jgi:hypothetical protein
MLTLWGFCVSHAPFNQAVLFEASLWCGGVRACALVHSPSLSWPSVARVYKQACFCASLYPALNIQSQDGVLRLIMAGPTAFLVATSTMHKWRAVPLFVVFGAVTFFSLFVGWGCYFR